MGLWLKNINSKTRRRSRRPAKVFSDPKQNPELKATGSTRSSSVFDGPHKIADEILSDPISVVEGEGYSVKENKTVEENAK